MLNQIFNTPNYIYSATTSGISVLDITGNLIQSKTIDGNITTLWGNDINLYIGTTLGLYTITYIDLNNDIQNSVLIPIATNNTQVTYIHGYDNKLLICTNSGIEYLDYSGNPFIHSVSNVNNTTKCFMTTTKAYYITHNTISGSVYAAINRKDNLLTDWSIESKMYMAGDGILPKDIYLTDIFVTETTALYGGNTIFCTTTSGVYIIDEDTTEYMVLNTQ